MLLPTLNLKITSFGNKVLRITFGPYQDSDLILLLGWCNLECSDRLCM
jgi:hypothetical protein